MNDRLKIVSKTGAPRDTEISIGDTRLKGVSEFTVRGEAAALFTSAELVIEGFEFSLEVDKANTEISLGYGARQYFQALGPKLTRQVALQLLQLADDF